MFINWLGQACFKIQTKDSIVIIHPFTEKETGMKFPRVKADIVVGYPHEVKQFSQKGSQAFVINNPGEYEVKDVFIYVKECEVHEQNCAITRLEIENVSIAHLDSISNLPHDKDLELIENCDILCIPVGGHEVLDSQKAISLINTIEPRIVIPMYYQIPGLSKKLDTVDNFVKKFGV